MQMNAALRVSYKFVFIIKLAVAAFFFSSCCLLIMYVSIQYKRLIKFAFMLNSEFNRAEGDKKIPVYSNN
jgi:hypothetical protein